MNIYSHDTMNVVYQVVMYWSIIILYYIISIITVSFCSTTTPTELQKLCGNAPSQYQPLAWPTTGKWRHTKSFQVCLAMLQLAHWHKWPPKIIPPPASATLWLTVHGQTPEKIPLLDPAAAHQYLGVYLTTNGNCTTEINTFHKHNMQYVQLMQTCPFLHWEAFVVYWQCYLPTVGYPLPATSMPATQLYKLQSPATSIFLTKLGYPRTFPQAITYVLPDQGGVGFLHLGHEQGLQKCLQLIKHLCTNTGIRAIYRIMLQHYQLLSGLPTSKLEDNWPLLWSNAP